MTKEKAYAKHPETSIYRAPGGRRVNTILMGTYVGIEEEEDHDGETWYRVRTAGPDGWIRESDTSDKLPLKVFFIDVGQGDGVLLETPSGKRVLIDVGWQEHVYNYLTRWQYTWVLAQIEEGGQGAPTHVHIDAVVLTHFDADHYGGLLPILKDRRFSIGTIYHNGIARFQTSSGDRPSRYNTKLGEKKGKKLVTHFDTFDDLVALRDLGGEDQGGFTSMFTKFADACEQAKVDGRLGGMMRLTSDLAHLPGFEAEEDGRIEVLGPVCDKHGHYAWFHDPSHTINGHSVVLKAHQGNKTVLLAGDLNAASQAHLLEHYKGEEDIFTVDVAKACHHGSSDFLDDFLAHQNAGATIISSGDNESHSHPRADMIGACGRHGRGLRPLVFCTELARSVKSDGDILYGMIHCRVSEGGKIVLAQMKESGGDRDKWDSYELK